MDTKPIGVFDSGLGGLTVVKELKKILPHENIIYFGDTGRVPYGTRGRDTVVKYACQDINFLLSQNVKMIIAACGTVSATLPQSVISGLPLPFTGVLLPAAQAACVTSLNGKIGVIGTATTIKSGAYGKAMRSIRNDAVITGNACPLFVPLIENGYIQPDNKVIRLVAEDYLKIFKGSDIDTLILGCTHFPIIRSVISDILGETVSLIDPGEETARVAAALLTKEHKLNMKEEMGTCHFYVSDSTENFAENGGLFLGESITNDVERISIEDYPTQLEQ